ncbi:hypothetical protein FC83_GL001947 [Agrilactobacillus composti DSM 18527 = JCM 14202]|uniref:ATP-grasp domain-containing protein n=2 Tax=Agrilactobacillus TaxID=2767875 RepID=A0A0R1XXR0_9LACO|nr:hypothetical protein FC83_GL001947 [Agrilactobacillus composti DSM 18527 = JCM 14202]
MEPLFAAKKMGVRVTVLTDSIPDIDDGYVDDFIVTDTYDMPHAVEKVKVYAKNKPINGVLTWADKDVELVSLIAKALNIPGPSLESSKNARDKVLMREAIAKVDPDLCPKFASVKNFAELKAAANDIGFPAVLKPVGASGSKTIIKIYSEDSLADAYQRLVDETSISRDKVYSYFPSEYIYEELLTGKEISIEGFVSTFSKDIVIAGMTDKEVTDEYSTEYLEYEPSQKSADDLSNYRTKIKQAIRGLGITECAFHAECKVDGTKFKVIEIAARPGGEFITTHLVKIASGVSFVEQNIKNSLGEEIDNRIEFKEWSKNPRTIVGHLDFMAKKEGIVTKLGGFQEIFEDPNVINFMPLKDVGDSVVLPPKDYGSLYTATMVVKGNSIDEIDESFKNIERKFKIEID